jgi:cell division protein FtsB
MQSEIDGPSKTDSLKQCISELKAENDKIRAENVELKARIAN